MAVTFLEKLRAAQRRNQSFLCVGLDPDPAQLQGRHLPSFLHAIIEETLDLVCAYKPNLAFFEALGPGGMNALIESLAPIPEEIPVIADAKRGDIGNTAVFYAKALFEQYDFDAATVNPWGGEEAVRPFLDYADKGVFVWCRGSNLSSADIQEQTLADGRKVFELVAELTRQWNVHGNAGLVAGAPYPEEIARVRQICPDMPLLIPGVGAQAGDLAASVKAALDADRGGIIINSSRQVLYASKGSDFARAARRVAQELRDQINRERESFGK
ncbi:MAG TPA: orotidine-5'-phosphate decarboxylase [Dehalococcoidia bacterium]|nr:orotidine-5'-phosphate decarboxylase [Dehalococcoidia bacterium]